MQTSLSTATPSYLHLTHRYCYQRLLDDGRPADLLTLPPAFYPDLKDFLQPRPEHAHLLWPLLLRTGDWGAAVSSLSLDAAANKVRALAAWAGVLCLYTFSSFPLVIFVV